MLGSGAVNARLPISIFALAAAVLLVPFASPKGAGDAEPIAHAKEQHAHGHGERPAYQRRFDDAEKWAQLFDDPTRQEWQKPDEVIEKMRLAPGMVVADIGAGTGYFLSYLSKAVGEEGKVWGVDIEPTLIEYMSKRIGREGLGNAKAVLAEPDDPKLEMGSVDRVLIVNTWHHISNRVNYGKKLFAMLKRDGAIYLVDYTKESPRGPPKEHRMPPEELKAELGRAGFEMEIVEESLSYQYMVVGRKPGE